MIHGIWIESSGNCLRIEKKLLNLYSEQSDIGYDISPNEGWHRVTLRDFSNLKFNHGKQESAGQQDKDIRDTEILLRI